MSKVFVSYKRVDKEIVFPFVHELESKLGIEFWIDLVGIQSDAQFADVIVKAINRCEVFLFMFSQSHQNINPLEDWTVRELSFAKKKKKHIVFLSLDGHELPDWFAFNFPYQQVIDKNDNQAVERLINDIRNWLDLSQSDTPTQIQKEMSANKMAILAWDYYNGTNGKAKNYSEAAKWFRKAAEQGHIVAQYNIAAMHRNGTGVIHDDKEAVKWYLKAAEQGYIKAQETLGYMYQRGDGVAQDYKEAAKWFLKAAEQGQDRSQVNIGFLYSKGYGVAQDYNEAVKWYRKAAEQGDADSQFNLGVMYKQGRGVAQDYKETAKWYLKAAEQGYTKAQDALGFMYLKGHGVAQDYKKAVKWYRKVAEQGNAAGQFNLGVMYENGYGVDQDLNEALKWYKKAAAQGNKYAIQSVERLKNK